MKMPLFPRLFLLVCAAALPLLASCNKNQEVRPSLNTSDTFEVVPLERVANENYNRFQIREWKFNINLPATHDRLDYALELREKNKRPQVVTGKGLSGFKEARYGEVSIALDPSEFHWQSASQLKTSLRMFGDSAQAVIDNPFKGCTSMETSGLPFRFSDGSYLLMAGNRGKRHISKNPELGADVVLVLKLKSRSVIPGSENVR